MVDKNILELIALNRKLIDETCSLSGVHEIIDMLEQQRIRNKAMLVDIIKDAFNGK